MGAHCACALTEEGHAAKVNDLWIAASRSREQDGRPSARTADFDAIESVSSPRVIRVATQPSPRRVGAPGRFAGMTSSLDAAIIPITLTVNGRIGLTLWAPPWEDDEGEEWQGFLGDGAKILLYPNARELAAFIASGEENDLSDHPAWGYVQKLTPDELRPGGEDAYNLDAVYEWAAEDPDPVHVSSLANVVDMVAKIADCCDDGALRRLVENTPEYEELVDEDVSYQGKDGRKRWSELGDTIADSWERAIARVESWLSWQGDFSDSRNSRPRTSGTASAPSPSRSCCPTRPT